jgi:beta-lactamase class D
MKKILLFCALLSVLSPQLYAAQTIDCIIVKKGNEFLLKEGKSCDVRYSPGSTFKIALSVMGFESGILKDDNHPIWHSKEPVKFLKAYWDGDKTPSSWMRYSVVWYSQILTTKLGMKKFQSFVDQFDYGNRDLSGNPGENDGLIRSWISSSLLISPSEQINFIEKLARNQLPASKESQVKTKNLMRLYDESVSSDNWEIYGKTGTDIDKKTKEHRAYFVGFAERNGEIISFVSHLSDPEDKTLYGLNAKLVLVAKMKKILFAKQSDLF